jgi:hypothetical protein
MRPHKAFGIDFEESEKITSNDQFLTDGSGAFRSLDNASWSQRTRERTATFKGGSGINHKN